MTTTGRALVERATADRGKDTYSQDLRDKPGYSDCSKYLQRIFLALAGIDIGSYTTAIASNSRGRTITTSLGDLAAGTGMQDGDVVLWGWRTDHRAGYPYSHVGLWDAAKRGTWDQYGDVPPHNGPNFHPASWGVGKADRCKVLRFLADEAPAAATASSTPAKARATIRLGSSGGDVQTWTAYLHANYSYGVRVQPGSYFGGDTEVATRTFQANAKLKVDGVVGPKTWAAAEARGLS